jgi:hypothetical protein
MVTVPGFLPSTRGLHFPNRWPRVPARTIRVRFAGFSAELPLGDASGGLCGGMVFAVMDLFERKLQPPAGAANPDPASAAFDYLGERLFESWGKLANGTYGARYYEWMLRPDRMPLVRKGTVDLSLRDSLPAVRASIDGERLVPLGLVCASVRNPLDFRRSLQDLGRNHQVLAYGYDADGTRVTLRIYDPNWPDRDDVRLTCDLDRRAQRPFTYASPAANPLAVRGFFVSHYEADDPARLFQGTAR